MLILFRMHKELTAHLHVTTRAGTYGYELWLISWPEDRLARKGFVKLR